jgi:pyridoxal 5'-phosphate synthase pdxT subunit
LVAIVTIGVVSIQGAVTEHLASLNRVFNEEHQSGKAILVRKPQDIDTCEAVIIPGGESTTISRFLVSTGIYERLQRRIEQNDIALMGTCAGCVLLAKEQTDTKADVKLLGVMDMQVERNAFGRQKESFERPVEIKGFSSPFHAIFIRAPLITKTWADCEVLATVDKKIVMARQKNHLALSFHPELTNDLRIHRFFLEML